MINSLDPSNSPSCQCFCCCTDCRRESTVITEDFLAVGFAAQMDIEDCLASSQEPPLDDVYKALDYIVAVGPIPAHHLSELCRDVFDRIGRCLERLELDAHAYQWNSAEAISEALIALPPEWGIWSFLSPYTPECSCYVA